MVADMASRTLPSATVSRSGISASPDGGDVARSILDRFRALPSRTLERLRTAAEVANHCGAALYWVGGGVRDLWFGEETIDLDLVVVGEIDTVAERLAAILGGRARIHARFLTAEVRDGDGFRIDLARARTERYARPAALPVVEPAEIESDSARRDFTINCLAIPLAPDFGERLLDPRQGAADLRNRELRTLHPGSFRDDPTRLVRAVDFAVRFDLRLEAETGRQFAAAVEAKALAGLSAPRLRAALERSWSRPATAGLSLARMEELRLLESAGLPITCGSEAPERVEAAKSALSSLAERPISEPFLLVLLSLALAAEPKTRLQLAARLGLVGEESDLVVEGPARVEGALAGLPSVATRSAAHRILGGLKPEELAFVASSGPRERGWVGIEWREMRSLRLTIGGRDLVAAGVRPGRRLGTALARTLSARLDRAIGPEEELSFALAAAEEGLEEVAGESASVSKA